MIYEPTNVSPSFSAVDVYMHGNNPVRKPLPISFVVHNDNNSPITNVTINIYSSSGVVFQDLTITNVTYPLYEGDLVNGDVDITSIGIDNGKSYSYDITFETSEPNIFVSNGTLPIEAKANTTKITLPNGATTAYSLSNKEYIQLGTELVQIKSVDDENNIVTLMSPLKQDYNKGSMYTIYSIKYISTQYYFTTAWNPKVTIVDVPNIVQSKLVTCYGIYSENINNIPYNYYEWTFYNKGNLIQTYRSSTPSVIANYNFSWNIDGLINGNEYTVGLFVEWQNGMTSTAQPITFTVEYEEGMLDIPVEYKLLCDQSAIQVTWDALDLIQAQGQIINNVGQGYQFVPDEPWIGNSSVLLEQPTTLRYKPVDVKGYPVSLPHVQDRDSNDGSYFFHVKLSPEIKAGNIISIEASQVDNCTVSTTPPEISNPLTGVLPYSYYINPDTNKFYKLIITNTNGQSIGVWDEIGKPLVVGDIYEMNQNAPAPYTNKDYTFDGTQLVEITETQRPYIRVQWNGTNKFTWWINIVTDNSWGATSGEYEVPAPMVAWLLQQKEADISQLYQWDDTATWDDSLYWTEQSAVDNFFARTWFKINIYSRYVNFEMMHDSEYADPKYDLFYYLGNELRPWKTGLNTYGASSAKLSTYMKASMQITTNSLLAGSYGYLVGGATPSIGINLSEFSGVGMVVSYSSPDPFNLLSAYTDEMIAQQNLKFHFNDLLQISPVQQSANYTTIISIKDPVREEERVFKWYEDTNGLFSEHDWLKVTSGVLLPFYNTPNQPPRSYTEVYTVFGTKPDDWQFLRYFLNVSNPATITLDKLVNNRSYMTALFNNYSAVQYMYKVCTGDFMAKVLSNPTTYGWLKESPYYLEVKNSEHWGLFINLMENDTPAPAPFPIIWESVVNNSSYVTLYREGYNIWSNVQTAGGIGSIILRNEYGEVVGTYSSNMGGIIRSVTPIDLTNVKSINATCNMIALNQAVTFSIMVSSIQGASTTIANQPNVVASTSELLGTNSSVSALSLDVANLTGQYYVSIAVCSPNDFNATHSCTITNVGFDIIEEEGN